MRLTILKDVDRTTWNRHVEENGGTCFHTYEYSKFEAEVYRTAPLYFLGTSGDRDNEMIAVGRLSVPTKLGVQMFRQLSFGSLPAAREDCACASGIHAIIEYARRHSIMTLTMNSFGTPYCGKILAEGGFEIRNRWEFILPLDRGQEDLWKSISPKKRNKIRKGVKEGIQVRTGDDLADVMRLRDLEVETGNRKKERGISYPVAEESYFLAVKRFLLDTGRARLYLAFDEGKTCVAGALFGVFNKMVYYSLSSASDAGLRLAAPDAILWKAIVDHISEKFEYFNFGGISEAELGGLQPEKAGLYVFKASFGSTPRPCSRGSLLLRPRIYKVYEMLKRTKRSR